jgi:hypothetical protein
MREPYLNQLRLPQLLWPLFCRITLREIWIFCRRRGASFCGTGFFLRAFQIFRGGVRGIGFALYMINTDSDFYGKNALESR